MKLILPLKLKRSKGKRLLKILKKDGHERFLSATETWLGKGSHYELDYKTGIEYYYIKNHNTGSPHPDGNNFRCLMIYWLGKPIINHRTYCK